MVITDLLPVAPRVFLSPFFFFLLASSCFFFLLGVASQFKIKITTYGIIVSSGGKPPEPCNVLF